MRVFLIGTDYLAYAVLAVVVGSLFTTALRLVSLRCGWRTPVSRAARAGFG